MTTDRNAKGGWQMAGRTALSSEPRLLSVKEMTDWAWQKGIPDVPYEKSWDMPGPIYEELGKRGYEFWLGRVRISEKELHEVLQACKKEVFRLLPLGGTREFKEKMDAAYWADVEAEMLEEMERLAEEDYLIDSEPIID